jgi:ferrochelatase
MTAFLNHDVGGERTTPSIEDTALLLARSGATNVALFAAGCFADGNPLYREAALRRIVGPSCQVRCISCLNASREFAGYLCDRIAAALQQLLPHPFS